MTVRIDLHVHSKYSSRPAQWILQKIGCPESFTEPLNLYEIAKLRGMTHVTITDHNRIAGALEIAHLPNTFVSEEITTYFPEDRCKIHILALNITEKQHKDIQHIRENIYDLENYLHQSKIFNIVAHPLYSVNGRLTIAHVEKLLLLFKNFEMNGARDDSANEALKLIIDQLTPADIHQLANLHDIQPRMSKPWEKNITGGSDDHSSLNIARTFTEIPRADSLIDALKGILQNRVRVIRRPSTPLTFAHNIYGIAYQYYRNKFAMERYSGSDTLLDFLDHCLQPGRPQNSPGLMAKLYCFWHYRKRPRFNAQVPETLAALIRYESGRLLYDNPQLLKIAKSGTADSVDLESKWFEFVDQTANRMVVNSARNLMNNLAGADVFNTFQTLGEAGGLYAMLAPYLISFSFFSQDREFSKKNIKHFMTRDFSQKPRAFDSNERVVAHFTDRFMPLRFINEILDNQISALGHSSEKMTVLTCSDRPDSHASDVRYFQPIGTYERPDLPGHRLLFPPFLEMLDHCFSKHVSHIHSATPGPVGLAALGVARILKIPVYGTFHPSLREYLPFAVEDESAQEILQRFMAWYYAQMDRIYVYNPAHVDLLVQYGIGKKKITLAPPAIDLDRFRPPLCNGLTEPLRGEQDSIKILFAGPVIRQNNLWLLAEVFKMLYSQRKNLKLIFTGDGPYLSELKKLLEGYPCTYHRRLPEAIRARVFGESTIFVCPGEDIDDGRALIEAQACGVPLVVTDREVPLRFISPGRTGLVYKHNDAANLYDTLLQLISDPTMRMRMARASRRFSESLSVDAAAFLVCTPKTTPFSPGEKPRLAEAV